MVLTAAAGRVYFFANAGPADTPLWATDGSEAGTVRVEGPTGFQFGSVRSFTPVGGRLVLVARDETGLGLWTTAAEGGSAKRIPILGDDGPMPLEIENEALVASGELIYFVADDGIHGRELWAFPRRNVEPFCTGDCDRDGTVAIADLVTGVAVDLARADLAACENLDADLDESVALAELVIAVGNALGGCR